MCRLNRCAALAAIFAAAVWAVPAPCVAAAANVAPETASPQTVPEDTEPGKSGSSGGSLSDKLDRSDGVIHPPPGIDPEMSKSPPPTGSTMPVIPPPGTPGGEPGVEPK